MSEAGTRVKSPLVITLPTCKAPECNHLPAFACKGTPCPKYVAGDWDNDAGENVIEPVTLTDAST